MDWNLVISIIALITGGGCVVWIFQAGIWKGEVNTKLEQILKYQESNPHEEKISSIVKEHLNQVKVDLNENNDDISEIIRNEFNTAITRIHQRLDDRAVEQQNHFTQQQNLESRLQVLISGLQTQRQDWDTLRDDVRSLLRSEATTTNEISNLKSTLQNLVGKIDGALQDIARLEAEVSHFQKRPR
jgi:chromosome segregation ATPase